MEGNGNGFTNKEILVQLQEDVREGFKEVKELYATGHGDHENRIRSLERMKNAVPSVALVSAIVSAAAIAVTIFH